MLNFKKITKLGLALVLSLSAVFSAACQDNSHTHDWGEWITVKEATCEKDGVAKRVCALDSSHVETKKIEALGHDYEWIITPATCSSLGEKYGKCKNDPSHVTETEVLAVDENAHAWTGGKLLVVPTCTQEGSREFICQHDSSHKKVMPLPKQHEWGAWELVSSPTCTETGSKKRTCAVDGEVETAEIPARGHQYVNGVCSVCGNGPVYPDAPAKVVYINPNDKNSGVYGTGTEYDRYEMSEGYYEVELGVSGVAWLSFSASRSGYYALYSIENKKNVTATRYDASIQYIPPDGEAAAVKEDGNFYSSISASEKHWNANWRATYKLSGKAEDKVKIRFVRIGEPAWLPAYEYQTVYPKQLTEKAPNLASNMLTREVPFDTEYEYNESTGYYQTKEGKTIYAAITVNAPRMFETGSLVTLPESGGSYNLYHSTAVDGNYIVRDYAWFLTNYGGLGKLDDNRNFIANEGDPDAVCYQNYVNKDGLYPVNQELYEFLKMFTTANKPIGLIDENNPTILANAWLAACYEYYEGTPGSADSPHEKGEGTFEVTAVNRGFVYYVFRAPEGAESDATYTLSTTFTNARIEIGDDAYVGASTIEIKDGTVFVIRTQDGKAATYEVTIALKS